MPSPGKPWWVSAGGLSLFWPHAAEGVCFPQATSVWAFTHGFPHLLFDSWAHYVEVINHIVQRVSNHPGSAGPSAGCRSCLPTVNLLSVLSYLLPPLCLLSSASKRSTTCCKAFSRPYLGGGCCYWTAQKIAGRQGVAPSLTTTMPRLTKASPVCVFCEADGFSGEFPVLSSSILAPQFAHLRHTRHNPMASVAIRPPKRRASTGHLKTPRPSTGRPSRQR